MITTKVQRTYGSHNRRNTRSALLPPSSPPSALASSPPPSPPPMRPTKRTIFQISSTENSAPLFSPRKRFKSTAKSLPAVNSAKPKPKALPSKAKAASSKGGQQKTLTQLHFNIDQSILRTCSLCSLTYTKGAPDDEALHRVHCTRVRQGMEWGREEEKDKMRVTESIVTEVRADVKLKGKKKGGRIISFPADVGGKLGAKLATLLQTINLSLSAPDLSTSTLQHSKAYIFLVPHETNTHRERIAGCVIARRISTAMAIVPSPPSTTSQEFDSGKASTTVIVDCETNLCCSPEPLPTPMGISRLFVASSHRRLGIAQSLLDAASATFIHGCPLDPAVGQVAFSQPTGMGQAVMKSWGKGGVRVYEE